MVLLQTALSSQLKVEGHALSTELTSMLREGKRVLAAMIQLFTTVNHGLAAKLAFALQRPLECRVWEGGNALRQLVSIGPEFAANLENKQFTSFANVMSAFADGGRSSQLPQLPNPSKLVSP